MFGLTLLIKPKSAWATIASHEASALAVLLRHTLPLALLPALGWYYGATSVGWTVAGELVRLTPESALPMFTLFYVAMVLGVLFLGFMVHWMAATYESGSTLGRAVTLISYTATPFFLAGLLGFYPLLWLDILIGVSVACYCIYLLFLGTSIVMHVKAERGFLYASAIFAVALVSFVALLGATVILWDFGAAPVYTY